MKKGRQEKLIQHNNKTMNIMKKDKLDTILSILLPIVIVTAIATLIFVGVNEKKKMDEWRQERQQEQETSEADQFMDDLNQWKREYKLQQEELERFKADPNRWDGANFID